MLVTHILALIYDFLKNFQLFQIHDLFSNHSWTDLTDDHDSHAVSMLQHWTTNYTDVFANLFIYILATFWLSILAATLPVPTGKKNSGN